MQLTWVTVLGLVVLARLTAAQTPCQIRACPSDTYCVEKPDRNTTCIKCDTACVGCDGPGPERCTQCKIGYVKPQGLVQPCEPCPVGYFGVNCTLRCHCLNNVLCNKTNGHCGDWKCERGYTGIPQCQDLCPTDTFGLDCLYECHCPENDNCSNVNGDCSSGRCHPEWGSSGCQRRLPKLALPPVLVSAKCNNITIRWDAFNETNDIGKGPVGQYRIYLRLNNTDSDTDPSWQPAGIVNNQTGALKYFYSVTNGLIQDEEYNFRVDAIGLEFGKLMSQISTGTSSSVMMNPCTIVTTPRPENTTKTVVSREVFEQITITALNSSFIRIGWTVLPEFRGYQYNVTIKKQLLGNGDCDSNGGPEVQFSPIGIDDEPVAISNLTSWSKYKITVNAVAKSADIRQTYVANVTTDAEPPPGKISKISEIRVSSTEAELSWEPLPCPERKGSQSSYDLLLEVVNNSSIPALPYTTQETRIRLGNLTPYTNFSVKVRYSNEAGSGPWSDLYIFETLEGVPSAVEISQLSPTYSTITVTFQAPRQANGILVTYTVVFSEMDDFKVFESKTEPVTNGQTIVIDRRKPETVYYLKMAASTSAGVGLYGGVKQTLTLQAPPPAEAMTLTLQSKTTNCLTVEWIAPSDTVADITSYVLETRRASADISTSPIRVELDVSQSSYQQCELKPSTLYIMTIGGTSVDGVITSATENFSTEHGTPPTPVVPVFVRSSYTNITIAIEPVVSPDVPITAYQIQAEQVIRSGRIRRFAGIPGYVAAELLPEQVTPRMEFIVGNGKSYGEYENKELEQDSLYMVYYVALSTLNNDTSASFSKLKAAVLTVPFDPALAPPLPISVASKNMTCLNLTWEIPTGVEDIVTGFALSLKETGEESLPVVTTELASTVRSYEECNLTPFTLYTASISVKTSNGLLATASETFSTVHNTPREPTAPVFVNSTYTSIAITIEPVVLTSAPLTAYHLQVEKVSSGNQRQKRVAGVPGYITAQLMQGNVTQKMDFIVGDGKDYGGYINRPLERETMYTVHYVVISTSSNITKFSFSSLNPPVRTVPYVPPKAAVTEESDNSVLIGVIVALVIFLVIIVILLILYWWWRRKNRFNPYEIQEDDKNAIILPEFKDDYNPERYWSAAFNLKDSRHIIAGRDLIYGERSQSYLNGETPQNTDMARISFKDEFHNLPHNSSKATDNAARQNRSLNRFPHLLPYDHSLVHLKPDANSERKYINASFIPGYKKTPAYIAAQSPYDEETVLDFWRLIYQRSIKTVVMITNIVEDNIVKCTQYWPDNTKASYGHFLLHLIEVTKYADYIVRTIGVKVRGDEYSKTVRLYEFTSWPDHGVPDDPIPFLEMRYKVRRYHHDENSPILVHCGTGMARTGVFIAIDALIDQYAAEGRVMVFDYVRRIRKDRPYMVRTLKQYIFIYEAIFEEFHAGDTLVDFDLKDRYHNWTQKNPRTDHTYLRDQFKLLEMFTRGPTRDECKTALLEVNIQKNRYLDVLAAEKHRPILRSLGGPNTTDYINAVFVDGYLKKNQFIITQTPLHTTIIDFWKLVYDYNVHTIVMVENFKNEDDTCAEYWPSVNLKQFEPFFIETTAAYQQDNITIRNFKIFSTQHPKESARFVRQFQFNAWAQPNLTPQSKTMMMDLIDSVFDWQEESCQNEKPIIVHCQDGSSHSGLFAILSLLCERMEEDEEVDVYRAIKHCKRRRTQFIADYDQFRFCYKTVWDFMNLRMPGGTFTDTLGQNKSDKTYGVASLNLSSYFDTLNGDGNTEI